MIWLGVAIMVVGFVIVIAGAKTQKQPIAIGGTILLLAGLALYAVFTFYTPPNTDYQVYAKAKMQQIGEFLKGKGGKIILVANPIGDAATSDYLVQAEELMKTAFGGAVERKNTGDSADPGMMSISVEDVNKILKETAENDIVVFNVDISLLDKSKKADFLNKSYKGGKIFFATRPNVPKKVEKDFKDAVDRGVILGSIVDGGKNEKDFTPDEDELKEAFDNSHVIMSKDNFDINKFVI